MPYRLDLHSRWDDRTGFTYNPKEKLLSLTDAVNHTTNGPYDNMDRVITRKDTLQRQESYSYDLIGNMAGITVGDHF